MIRVVTTVWLVCLGIAASAAPQNANAEKIFVQQECSLCHSIAGKGNTKGPLDAVGSKLSTNEVRSLSDEEEIEDGG